VQQIHVAEPLTIKELSAATGVKAVDIIKKLFLSGTMATINSAIDREVAIDMMMECDIDLIVDVGANAGQYAQRRRKEGYVGAIVSFEPLRAAFTELRDAASRDPRWSAHNLALGDAAGPRVINVAANSYSSSFLQVLPAHMDAAPAAAFCGREEVEMQMLDALPHAWFAPGARLLKIDAQGFEATVLHGARQFLDAVALVELELSILPIYEGQELAHEMLALMRERGFCPVALEASYSHPVTGEIQCVDAIFARM
jgi:FkbM family methyltransferase